jgi:hypothetical protein
LRRGDRPERPFRLKAGFGDDLAGSASGATTSTRPRLSSAQRGVHNDQQIYEFFLGSRCLEAFSARRLGFPKDILPSHLWEIAAACDAWRSQVKKRRSCRIYRLVHVSKSHFHQPAENPFTLHALSGARF